MRTKNHIFSSPRGTARNMPLRVALLTDFALPRGRVAAAAAG